MASLNGFDANKVEPSTGGEFHPLPKGDYTCIITDSSMKASKSGGEYLELVFQVVEGQYANRKLWSRLNLTSPNSAKAEEISQQQLSSICRAVGVMTPGDSAELHDKPILCYVTAEQKMAKSPVTGKYDIPIEGEYVNEIKGFKPTSAASHVVTPMHMPQKSPAAASSKPWQRQAA